MALSLCSAGELLGRHEWVCLRAATLLQWQQLNGCPFRLQLDEKLPLSLQGLLLPPSNIETFR